MGYANCQNVGQVTTLGMNSEDDIRVGILSKNATKITTGGTYLTTMLSIT